MRCTSLGGADADSPPLPRSLAANEERAQSGLTAAHPGWATGGGRIGDAAYAELIAAQLAVDSALKNYVLGAASGPAVGALKPMSMVKPPNFGRHTTRCGGTGLALCFGHDEDGRFVGRTDG